MATVTEVLVVNDLGDGTILADETVAFGLEGTDYEIDLTAENAAQMREALAPYVSVAKRGKKTGKNSRTVHHRTVDLEAVRQRSRNSRTSPGESFTNDPDQATEAGQMGSKLSQHKRVDREAVRTWAREEGYTVAKRGRISKEITAAYEAAHQNQ